jgi:hypothetical protein
VVTFPSVMSVAAGSVCYMDVGGTLVSHANYLCYADAVNNKVIIKVLVQLAGSTVYIINVKKPGVSFPNNAEATGAAVGVQNLDATGAEIESCATNVTYYGSAVGTKFEQFSCTKTSMIIDTEIFIDISFTLTQELSVNEDISLITPANKASACAMSTLEFEGTTYTNLATSQYWVMVDGVETSQITSFVTAPVVTGGTCIVTAKFTETCSVGSTPCPVGTVLSYRLKGYKNYDDGGLTLPNGPCSA